MFFGGYSHVSKDMTDPGRHKKNDNLMLDEASLYYGGQIAPHVGTFWQASYSGADDNATLWDMVEARGAWDTQLAKKDLTYGFTINNGPSMSDLWQTAMMWQFPYFSNDVAPAPMAMPYLMTPDGTIGLGAFGMWNDTVYAELDDYASLQNGIQRGLGIQGPANNDHLMGFNPYWRVALQHDFGPNYASIGMLGFYEHHYPGNDRTSGTDSTSDTGIDATFQRAVGDNSYSLYASYIHEKQNLNASVLLGNSTNATDKLNTFEINGSYYYQNTYGITAEYFNTTGSQDAKLYMMDSTAHKPDNAGWTLQADYTPWGKNGSPLGTNFNVRLFARYTYYLKFNGGTTNYNGAGRNASDNNLLYTGMEVAF